MNAQTERVGEVEQVLDDVNSILENVTDGALAHLPIESIAVRDGFNPRRYFGEKEMNELADSIKAQGVIQPIVVKPNDSKDGFNLVAGERRFRASKLAGLTAIPAVIRILSDEEALALAVTENSERDDVSAVEEAKACQRMLHLCDGDREEAARSLGWSLKKLEARLLLLHCSEAVQDALEQRKIKIGHAELLAGLDKEMQDLSLKGITENNVSVQQLKESIGRYAYKLKDAVFDTAGCVGCKHNSGGVSDLFDQNIGDGHCMNRDCYDEKTQSHLMASKSEYEGKYPVVYLDVEKPEDTHCHLVREGESGVGREQYSACQGCAKFGALMSTEKGKEGSMTEGVCFDVKCNSKMVKAHREELAEEAKAAEQAQTAGQSGGDKKPSSASTSKTAKGNSKSSAALPKKVQNHINKKHHEAAVKITQDNVSLVKIMSVIALTDACRDQWMKKDSIVKDVLKRHGVIKLWETGAHHDKIAMLSKLDDAAINEIVRASAASFAGENFKEVDGAGSWNNVLKTAQTILAVGKADMKDHFIVDEDFLNEFTLSGLKALLQEAGFIEWYDGQDGKKAGSCAKEVLTGKRDTQISNVLEAGFDWQGFVPKAAEIPAEIVKSVAP